MKVSASLLSSSITVFDLRLAEVEQVLGPFLICYLAALLFSWLEMQCIKKTKKSNHPVGFYVNSVCQLSLPAHSSFFCIDWNWVLHEFRAKSKWHCVATLGQFDHHEMRNCLNEQKHIFYWKDLWLSRLTTIPHCYPVGLFSNHTRKCLQVTPVVLWTMQCQKLNLGLPQAKHL